MASFPPGTLDQATIEIVYSPLYVLSSGPTYKALKGQIGAESYLGILDAKDFDPQKRDQFDPDKIRGLGPFAVHDLAELGGVTSFLEGATRFLP